MSRFQDVLNECEEKIKTGWEDHFSRYLQYVENAQEVEVKLINKYNKKIENPIELYSSVTTCKELSYDVRFYGQSIATVSNNQIKLQNNLPTYFDNIPDIENLTVDKAVEALSSSLLQIKDLNSAEHKFESRLLKYMNVNSKKDILHSIKPVTINGLFFQMPTFFAASNHKAIEFKSECGKSCGGIDILARIQIDPKGLKSGQKGLKSGQNNRLCIMELKDSIKKGEEPKEIIEQAIAYSCCIHKLLRSEDGQKWYDCFRGQKNTESKAIPNPLELYACVVVPFGEDFKKENIPDHYKINEEILFENGDKLCLRYMYLEMNDDFTDIINDPITNLELWSKGTSTN